jgi:hypothetical protein
MKKISIVVAVILLCFMVSPVITGAASDAGSFMQDESKKQISVMNEVMSSDETEARMLAKVMWGEARGLGMTERAMVAWCVLNRVDSKSWSDTVSGVVKKRHQFNYSGKFPVTKENLEIAKDVLLRWRFEKIDVSLGGRVLPKEYTYFSGNGKRNLYRTSYRGGSYFKGEMLSPYAS